MSSLSIGIVGLPNVGKSTLFKLLTKKEVNIANYPFCTIDPNVGIVAVPDERLNKLALLSNSQKIVPAVVEFYDIAGLVKGANQGAGLGNQFLAQIREVDMILVVLRCFANGEIIHVENSIDPLRDMEIINTELMLKDLETVSKRLAGVEREIKARAKEALNEQSVLEKVKSQLERGKLISDWAGEGAVKNLQLLTAKKQIYLLNGLESDASNDLKDKIKEMGGDFMVADLSGQGVNLNELVKKVYNILDLISFLTTGPEETRAWSVRRGAKAPEAAGVIHTDFENKFIKAEIVDYGKLVEVGSWPAAKAKGWIRLEGRDYEMKDGDVVYFRHG